MCTSSRQIVALGTFYEEWCVVLVCPSLRQQYNTLQDSFILGVYVPTAHIWLMGATHGQHVISRQSRGG